MNHSSAQVSKEHYFHGYDHKARWLSYRYQWEVILKLGIKNVLEIGIGNGTVADYLRKQGVLVTTLDIDPALKPDIVASLLEIPRPDNSFDVVMACEALEHLPFEQLALALRELGRVSKKYILISLPDHRRTLLYCVLKIPFLPEIAFRIRTPSFITHIFDGQHYWEIGKIGFPPHRIRRAIREAGLFLVKEFVKHDAPMNHYFLIKKP